MIDFCPIDLSHAGQTAPLLKTELLQQNYARTVHTQQNGENVFKAAIATTVHRV